VTRDKWLLEQRRSAAAFLARCRFDALNDHSSNGVAETIAFPNRVWERGNDWTPRPDIRRCSHGAQSPCFSTRDAAT